MNSLCLFNPQLLKKFQGTCFSNAPFLYIMYMYIILLKQGSHWFEKYLNLEGFLEKSLKIKYALKSTGKSLKYLEKSLNSTIFCRT